MPKKSNVRPVHPDHSEREDFNEQEREAFLSGSARKPQVGEIETETIEITDLDRAESAPVDDVFADATVARGRTVEAPIQGKRRVVGQTNDGVMIYGPVVRRFGPGQTVSLPMSEIRRLRELGFLIDPNAATNTIQDGSQAKQDGAHQFFRRS